MAILADEPPVAAKPAETPRAEPASNGFGTFIGQVVFDGVPPVLPPLVKEGEATKDPQICSNEIPDERLVVDAKTRGIRDVFVYIKKAPSVHPDLRKGQPDDLHAIALKCRYIPHALFAQTNQMIRFKSEDKSGHNLHFNATHPFGRAFSDRSPDGEPIRFKQTELTPMSVTCDVHPWMNARWLILDHPYAAITDAAGKFQISKFPAGDHQFVVWQESAGYLVKELKVTIKPDQTTDQGVMTFPLEKFIHLR